VHQFCRVGRLAMVAGCARIVQDVPPFVLTDGDAALIVGLNKIGLKRSGMTDDEILQVKQAYRVIYRQGLLFNDMVAALEERFHVGPASEFAEFFRNGKRGFIQERRSPPRATVKLHTADDEADDATAAAATIELKRRAG
jgi:UDP-N-acetylglucosamine acyltransferase